MSTQEDNGTPKLVLFDLDGTLADTFKDLYWALNQALEEHGQSHADANDIRVCVSQGARAMLRAALPAQPSDFDFMLERFLQIYERHVATRTTLFDGIEQVLNALDLAGIEYGVVTNKLARFSEPLIDKLQLRSRLSCLVSGDTAARAKPHPDPLQLAANICKLPVAQCVYVGDAYNDVLAARAARMRVAVATYGYLGVDDEPRNWNADALIAQPAQLHGWLLPSPDGQRRREQTPTDSES